MQMFTRKVRTDDSRLLQESNLAARQPRRAPHHVIQTITSEELAQGPYVSARVVFEPATFRAEGTEHHHSTTTPLLHGLHCITIDKINHLVGSNVIYRLFKIPSLD